MNQIEKLKEWIESRIEKHEPIGYSERDDIRADECRAILDHLNSLPSAPEDGERYRDLLERIERHRIWVYAGGQDVPEPTPTGDMEQILGTINYFFTGDANSSPPPPTVPVGSTGRERASYEGLKKWLENDAMIDEIGVNTVHRMWLSMVNRYFDSLSPHPDQPRVWKGEEIKDAPEGNYWLMYRHGNHYEKGTVYCKGDCVTFQNRRSTKSGYDFYGPLPTQLTENEDEAN